MSDYGKMRINFLAKLDYLTPEDIAKIGLVLDEVVLDYNVSQKSTELVVCENNYVPELVKIYVATKAIEQCSENTVQEYSLHLRLFFDAVRMDPEKVRAEHIRLFLYDYQKRRGIKDQSLDVSRRIICGFFKWAHEEGYISTNPGRSVKEIRYEKVHRSAIPEEEMEMIRRSCADIREKALVEFFYSTGCRISEVANVKIEDIDLQNRTVKVFGKGKKHRNVYLTARAYVALKDYLEEKPDSEYLFISQRKPYPRISAAGIRKILYNIEERAGIGNRYTPHQIRHTTATDAIKHGMPITSVQAMLGHSKVDTTMGYVDICDDTVKREHQKYVS